MQDERLNQTFWRKCLELLLGVLHAWSSYWDFAKVRLLFWPWYTCCLSGTTSIMRDSDHFWCCLGRLWPQNGVCDVKDQPEPSRLTVKWLEQCTHIQRWWRTGSPVLMNSARSLIEAEMHVIIGGSKR